jgi:hypothetical protein
MAKKNFFVLGLLKQRRMDKNLLYVDNEPNEAIKEEPPSFVLLGSPFASVSTVSGGHSSLVSLS